MILNALQKNWALVYLKCLKIAVVMIVNILEMVHTNLFELVLCTDHNQRGNLKRFRGFIVKPKLLRAMDLEFDTLIQHDYCAYVEDTMVQKLFFRY